MAEGSHQRRGADAGHGRSEPEVVAQPVGRNQARIDVGSVDEPTWDHGHRIRPSAGICTRGLEAHLIMHRVSISRVTRGVHAALVEALALVGSLESFVAPGDRVLIKPNLNGEEGFTAPDLTIALVALLRDLGVGEVVIAESTFGTASTTDRLFQATGYADLAKELDVELVNLNRSETVEVSVTQPLVTDRLRIAREVIEADRLINLPNLKVHYATGITGAMKNLKGVLVGVEKRRFHEIGLDKAIADLNRAISPDLNVVDAISCMERMGPRGGDQVRLDLVMAGANAGAVDWVAAQVMRYLPEEIAHLNHFAEQTGMNAEDVVVCGESVESVAHPFKRATVAQIVPSCFTVHERGACSACMNAFLLSCQLLQHTPGRRVDVYLGADVAEVDEGAASSIAFGNCCPGTLDADLRVRGCPPYPFALGETLTKAGWAD